MKWIITIYTTVLFIIFNPNTFTIFSKKTITKYIILIHAFLFGIFYFLTIDYIYYLTTINENFCNNCNENNINCFNNLGQQCVLKNSNYGWDLPCNNLNVNNTTYSGNTLLKCVNIQSNNINDNIYNWVPINL